MKFNVLKLLLVKRLLMPLVILICLDPGQAAESVAGRYYGERPGHRGEETVRMDLEIGQTNGKWTLTGGACYWNESPPVPDIEGVYLDGKDNVLRFHVTDTFGNEGTLSVVKDGRDLTATFSDITVVKEPKCLPLYEKIVLKQIGEKYGWNGFFERGQKKP